MEALVAAAGSQLHADSLREWRDDAVIARAGQLAPHELLTNVLPTLPLLDRGELRRRSRDALTREVTSFLHYFESSGTTGDPVAAPKAVDDLVVNTANIGEMWVRLVGPEDVALVLINGPFAPAGYQFEKVLEYLGVMSMRLWVDNVTGDYTRVLRQIRELAVNTYVGSASRLLEMLHFALRSGERLPRFERLLLLAEQTGPAFLRHLERLTGAKAYVASYGSSETGTTAATCEQGRLHLQPQSYLFELHDERGTRLVDGTPDTGELVVTTLDLPGRPLVRYRTGDLVTIAGAPCPCGLALPVVETRGREQDALVLAGGAVRQEDFEAALWPGDEAGPTVLDYMLVVRHPDVVCLATVDRTPGEAWSSATARRLGALFTGHRFALRTVDRLPPSAALGAYVGWKLSRVLDLDGAAPIWDQLPPPLAAVITESLDVVEAATGLCPTRG
ncbi:phenylacetate--CoA ligase family protein [Streptomyces sp. NPDC002540]